MVVMNQERQKAAKSRGGVKRAAIVLTAAVGVLAAAGSALAGTGEPDEPKDVPAAAVQGPAVDQDAGGNKKPGFFETYRGHHIMGWGAGESACAYIDGKRLVLYPQEGGKFTSAILGFQPHVGVRNITKASVKALGELKLTDKVEPSTACPEFAPPKTAAPSPSTSATSPAKPAPAAPAPAAPAPAAPASAAPANS